MFKSSPLNVVNPAFQLSKIATLLSLILWPAIGAQAQATNNQTGNEMVVSAATEGAPPDNYMAPGETTLGKLPLKTREIAQSVSVTDREQLDQQNMRNLDDVMAQSTGVTSAPFIMSRTAYYVRGFQVNAFEMDGVPVLLSEMGSASPDMSVYERVEMLRGSNGLLHGNGNPAATINMVRKHAPHDYQADIKLETGSWNRYRGELDVGGPLNEAGTVRGRSVVAWEDGRYFYQRAQHQNRVFYGTVDADLAPDTLLRLGAEYQSIRGNPNIGGLPMAASGRDLQLSRDTNLDGDWTHLNYYTTRLFAGLEHQFSDAWQGKINLDYQDAETNNRYAVLYGDIDAQRGDGGAMAFNAANRYENHHLGMDASLTGQQEAFGQTHQLIAGVSYANANTEQYTAASDPSFALPVNIYHWDPTSVTAPALSNYTTPGSSTTIQKGLYGMGRIKLADPLTLVVGGRESWWQARTPTESTDASAKFTPYGGLIWDFGRNWSWYASYASVWQPQTYMTYNGALLDPMKGDTWETGVKTTLNNGALNLSFATFRINLQNTPLSDTQHLDASTNYYINGGDASSKGIELEASGYLTPYWNLFAGYSWLQTAADKTLSVGTGTPYSNGAPRHMLRLWTNYDLPWDERRWSIGGGVQAQNRSSGDYDPSLHQGGYMLVNMRVGYHINDNWSTAVNINNLFDQRYYAGLFMHQFANRYGEPRNVSVNLIGHF